MPTTPAMSAPQPQPPLSPLPPFSTAADRYSDVLREQGSTGRVVWAFADDAIVVARFGCFVSVADEKRNREVAHAAYLRGVAGGLGVELKGVCANDDAVYATVAVPHDVDEALDLQIAGLKLSGVERPLRVWRVPRWLLRPLRWLFGDHVVDGHFADAQRRVPV